MPNGVALIATIGLDGEVLDITRSGHATRRLRPVLFLEVPLQRRVLAAQETLSVDAEVKRT